MSLFGTISPQTANLVNAAARHSQLITEMGKNGLIQRFAQQKKVLKELVHQAIDSGYSKAGVMRLMPQLPNPNDPAKDRFVAKVNRYYKKHKALAGKGPSDNLMAQIRQAAHSLKATYVDAIDKGAQIGQSQPAVYTDYRKVKENYKNAAKALLKGKTEVELQALQAILNSQNLHEKTVNKLKTFHTKFNRVKAPQPDNSCSKIAYAVVALTAAFALSVLIKVSI